MKTKGFRKMGRYDYGATFDKAIYKSDEVEVNIIYSIHPYDYPYHGIKIKVINKEKIIEEKLYSFSEGGIEFSLNSLAEDLKQEKIKINA